MASTSRPDRRRLALDLEVSRVVTGLWQVADMERRGRKLDLDGAARAMGVYVDAGFTTFDMADHYGSAEEIAGRLVAAGGRAELLTKWVPEPGPIGREMVRTAVQRALQRLKRERIDLLQFHAWRFSYPSWLDALFFLDELRDAGLERQVAQAFAVLLPVQAVGVQGDARTYEDVIAIRAVETEDFMTADWSRLPHDLLARVSTRRVKRTREPVGERVSDEERSVSKPGSTVSWAGFPSEAEP